MFKKKPMRNTSVNGCNQAEKQMTKSRLVNVLQRIWLGRTGGESFLDLSNSAVK